MDSLSVSKLNRLYWLGRYYERLATTLGYLWDWYDVMIDGDTGWGVIMNGWLPPWVTCGIGTM